MSKELQVDREVNSSQSQKMQNSLEKLAEILLKMQMEMVIILKSPHGLKTVD